MPGLKKPMITGTGVLAAKLLSWSTNKELPERLPRNVGCNMYSTSSISAADVLVAVTVSLSVRPRLEGTRVMYLAPRTSACSRCKSR